MVWSWSPGNTISGSWAKAQPLPFAVKVQTTSNRSSGHVAGGEGVTAPKAAAIAGISPWCQQISVGPD